MHTDRNGQPADHPRGPGPGDAGSFAAFLRRVRAGDAQAAAELVRRYESAVRREARQRLRNPRLRRVVDSMDICQAALASFFVRAAAGRYELDHPAQLLRLLVSITRHEVAYQARKELAQRRDNRRVEAVELDSLDVADTGPGPGQVAAGAEMLEEFRRRLTPEERRLADLRAEGRGWAEIAGELGGTPQARRMQWNRVVERTARELRLKG